MRVVTLLLIAFLNVPLVLWGQVSAGCAANPPFFREEIWAGSGNARRNVRFPAPSGFESVFNADWDFPSYLRAATPNPNASNTCLLLFKPLKNNLSDKGRSFSVQVQRAFDHREIGERITCDISYPVRAVVARQKLRRTDQLEGKADTNILNAEKALKQHGAEILGIFEDSPVSLGFTMTMEVANKIENEATKTQKVYAIIMMPMGGGLIQLYAETEYISESDRRWAESTVRAWRKNILAFNPPVKSGATYGSDPRFEGFEPVPFMGGVLGTVVSVFVTLLQLFEKRRASRAAITESLDTQPNLPFAEA